MAIDQNKLRRAPTTTAPPLDSLEAKWRHLTADLIFAAADYGDPRTGTITWLRILDRTGRPYNREQAVNKCKLLHQAIAGDFAHLAYDVLRAHAANDSLTFRLRYSHLLPKRPPTMPRVRRPGPSDEQREKDMEAAFE